MLKKRRNIKRAGTRDWNVWTHIACEGKRVNQQVSRESEELVEKTDTLVSFITDHKTISEHRVA